MNEFRKFKEVISGSDYAHYRNNLRENFTGIENYCKANGIVKNQHEWLSHRINLMEFKDIENDILELIKLDYVRANDFEFQVKPIIKNATDFLRNDLLDEKNEHTFKNNQTRALLYIIEQVRNNLTHDGKVELENNQFQRNEDLIKCCSRILECTVQNLE